LRRRLHHHLVARLRRGIGRLRAAARLTLAWRQAGERLGGIGARALLRRRLRLLLRRRLRRHPDAGQRRQRLRFNRAGTRPA